jgi:hypothetical protein
LQGISPSLLDFRKVKQYDTLNKAHAATFVIILSLAQTGSKGWEKAALVEWILGISSEIQIKNNDVIRNKLKNLQICGN